MVMCDLELLARAVREEGLHRAERRRLVEEARRAARTSASGSGASGGGQACLLHIAGRRLPHLAQRLGLGNTARWRRRLAIGPV